MKYILAIIKFYVGISVYKRFPYGVTWYKNWYHKTIAFFRKSFVIGSAIALLTLIFIAYREITPKTVYADREVIKEVKADSPIMERIADCESGVRNKNGTAVKGSASHRDPKTGQVYTKANENKTVDIGRYMINETYWGKKANEMKLDLTKEEDNKTMAYWIYYNRGTVDWSSSSNCWNR